MILAAILAIRSAQAGGPRDITMGEAAAEAQWFFRCVDMQPAPRIAGISYSANDRSTYGGVPRYHVSMKSPQSDWPYHVQIDAVSGQVLWVSNLHGGSTFGHPPKAVSDRWLRRLGLRGLAYDAQLSRYDLEEGQTPFCNLNGDSQAAFLMQDGRFAWYIAPAAAPPVPVDRGKVTEAEAESLAVAERKKTVPSWPLKLVFRTSKVVFFDDRQGAAEPAWKVEEGSVTNGQYHESWTHYVDADSGSVISDERLMASRLVYRSGPPRSGLAHVPLNGPLQAALHALADKMRQLGRLERDPVWLTAGPTLDFRFDDSVQVSMKPNGDLVSLLGQATNRPMPDAAAMAFGKKLILAQHPSLGEGRFELQNVGNSRVDYVQTAFGYPYLDHTVAFVQFDSTGVVSTFRVDPPLPRPLAAPGRLVGTDSILAKATEAAKSDAVSGSIVRSASVKDLGWWTPESGGHVRLAYRVRVVLQSEGRLSNRLGLWVGLFDAQSGELLQGPPKRT